MSGPAGRHVVVLAGGLSAERDVSLRSGRRLATALREAGAEVTLADLDGDLLGRLRALDPDCVVPVVHGPLGEDGALATLLDLAGIPFLGPRAAAARLTFDKPLATAHMAACGVPVPRQVTLPQALLRDVGAAAVLDLALARTGLPCVVKPAAGGSALGVSIVTEPHHLPGAIVGAYSYAPTAVIEEYIAGQELAVTIVDEGSPEALPAVEIVPVEGWYDAQARYTAGAVEFFAPARLSTREADVVQACALAAHRALGLRDLTRIDLILGSGGPRVLEATVAPGLTETSLAPLAIAAAGRTLGEVVGRLVERACASPEVAANGPAATSDVRR